MVRMAKTMTTRPTPTGLHWNERGAVACAAHTPYDGTDTWIWERWEPVPTEALADPRSATLLRCETCGLSPRDR